MKSGFSNMLQACVSYSASSWQFVYAQRTNYLHVTGLH